MSVINTNLMSLNAQRNLYTSQASLSMSMQRLSSGLRINSAKDDAAGLAISQRFTTQIRGLDVAVRNANDAISLAQTAEGAMASVGNNLQRIRELAVQSANATNSSTDRAALNAEVKQLVSEIDRVAKQTEFNGTKLLDGTFTAQLFQVGANAGQAISINETANAQSSSLGTTKFATATNTGASGVEATAAGTLGNMAVYDRFNNAIALNDVHYNVGDTGADVTKRIVAAINEKVGETGLYAEVDGANIKFTTLKEYVSPDDPSDPFMFFNGGDGLATAGITRAADTAINTTTPAVSVSNVDISTSLGSQHAIAVLDKALNYINTQRANLGAVQNRFSSVVENLQINNENLTSSRSRIMDADFAKETSNLSRSQVLQQAGMAMVAQANQAPQGVLALLR